MTVPNESSPSFNLWTEPWITLQARDGALVQHSIRETLLNAADFVAIHDLSPLVVVGIHRLLVAILQAALNPQENADLEALWEADPPGFPAHAINDFGAQYADRFDLFSPDKPFLQSADLLLFPSNKAEQKERTSVARLFAETPSGTEVTHYRHTTEDDCVLCPADAAKALVTIPPFVSSGGPGLMPSINGVPPIYVLPGGQSLFESLVASLVKPSYFPTAAPPEKDLPWWRRDAPTIIMESEKGAGSQISAVGYLYGLTFPARKVRLQDPEPLSNTCSRCGQTSRWCVRKMTFRMGESRPENAHLWQDPFAAYRLPVPPKPGKKAKTTTLKKKDQPTPIRPNRRQAVWREFGGLFLQQKEQGEENQRTMRPRFLDQWGELSVGWRFRTYPFRCIAIQTDGKAKNFAWLDFGFDVPPALLQDPIGADYTWQALEFASACAQVIADVFSATFGKKDKNRERFKRLKARMEADYWDELAGQFRQFVLDMGQRETQLARFGAWLDAVQATAQGAFERAAEATPDDGSSLRLRVEGRNRCCDELFKTRYQRRFVTGAKA